MFDATRPQQGYVLPLAIPEGDECYDDKLDIVETERMKSTQQFIIEANKPPAQEMLAFLRLINISGMPISQSARTTVLGVSMAGCSLMIS